VFDPLQYFSFHADKYHAWVNGEFLLKKYKLGYLVREREGEE
jgi:hypothetical protein